MLVGSSLCAFSCSTHTHIKMLTRIINLQVCVCASVSMCDGTSEAGGREGRRWDGMGWDGKEKGRGRPPISVDPSLYSPRASEDSGPGVGENTQGRCVKSLRSSVTILPSDP